jgi:hypothetical protein
MDMIDTIRTAWSWIGLAPAEIVATNAFGNLIVRSVDGAFWRICPEELSCAPIAWSQSEYERLLGDAEFVTDWEMTNLVELARDHLGPLSPGRCYCLKMPAILGGGYEASNLGTNSRFEVIAFSGDVAQQLKDVPDGGRVKISIVR